MSRKRRPAATHHHNNVVELTQALYLNGRAMQEGPKRKNWSIHDLKHIRPLTPAQNEMFQDFLGGNNVFAHGSAGTGKSFVALYLAMNDILRNDTDSECDRVIIVRSAVPTRSQGFLPGDLNEKLAVYELPYKDIVADLFGKRSTYDDMKEMGKIEFLTTSYIRGLTWDNAVIVVDEVQDCNIHELNSIMTRVGEGSRIILCGDTNQNDLLHSRTDVSGLPTFMNVVKRMSSMTTVTFTHHDCVRSAFVKEWLGAYEAVSNNR